jgi:hypothetical protein
LAELEERDDMYVDEGGGDDAGAQCVIEMERGAVAGVFLGYENTNTCTSA